MVEPAAWSNMRYHFNEKEERKDELDQALESIGKDDQMPDYNTDRYNNQPWYRRMMHLSLVRHVKFTIP